jgi:hypothetical protein
MSRLITFGCSITYGHGLEDCYIEPNNPGLVPSQKAWPSLLANMLDLELINCSNPGASNLHILWKLLNFDFNDDDLCIVMWSFFGRLPYSNLKYDSSIVNWNDYSSRVVKQLPELEEESIVVKNYMSIHHGYLYLLSKKIKHNFIIWPTDGFRYANYFVKIPTMLREINGDHCEVDKALDKSHPGPKSHMLIATKLFEKINVIH